jgi:hypothetical protein
MSQWERQYLSILTHHDFQWKKVPFYATSTESGSITSLELTLMLKWIDDREIFDRSDGVDPMLIIDGHISRMMALFL